MLKIQLLGHFRAERDGSELPDLNGLGAERLLALLALYANRPVRNTWVAAALWPDTCSLFSVRKASQRLKVALGPEATRFRAENNTLYFELSAAECDVVAFDTLLARNDHASHLAAFNVYTSSLLTGWDYAWVLHEREMRDRQIEALVAALLETATRGEQFALVAQILSLAVSIYPDHEDWWTQLIAAQAKSGARLEALTTGRRYLQHLQNLSREQGCRIPPAPAIREMIRQIQVAAQPIGPHQVPDLTAYEAVGGTSPLDSPYYVERPEDLETHVAIAQRTSIVLIKGARQTGKSSLLARALHRARWQGATVLRTEGQRLLPEDLQNASAFYRAQAQALAEQAQLDVNLDAVFRARRAPSYEFERFMRDHLLAAVPAPLLWAIDDADRLFACSFRDDVFALFRSWHNERAFDETGPWQRFTLALAYSAEAHLAIRNLNQSPFNVGTRVTLGDFTPGQLGELNARYGDPLNESEINDLWRLVGGHPYLVRRALHEVKARHVALDDILARAEQDGGLFADHLNHLLDALRTDPDLCADLRRILAGDAGDTGAAESIARLCAGGLLVMDASGSLSPRCRLYDRFLRRRLS